MNRRLFCGLWIALAALAGCEGTPANTDDAYSRDGTTYLRTNGDGYRREDRVHRNDAGRAEGYELKWTTPQ